MNDYHENLPKKRMGAGALMFNDKDELLLVKPSYKEHWSIPGGVVDAEESPRNACVREVEEEIGIRPTAIKFLCVDYYPTTDGKGENIQFIFFGGRLNSRQISQIRIDGKEILEYTFVPRDSAISMLGPRLAKRLSKSLEALDRNSPVYLEGGE
ncbi:NUDIX hydrolase [Candidatus Parcubacteria bacterium]|nr:MAG: NUDIX hydrolase [Candidatus Parcubacteria bacterium]